MRGAEFIRVNALEGSQASLFSALIQHHRACEEGLLLPQCSGLRSQLKDEVLAAFAAAMACAMQEEAHALDRRQAEHESEGEGPRI